MNEEYRFFVIDKTTNEAVAGFKEKENAVLFVAAKENDENYTIIEKNY